jgi:formylglycine-generating enzyme required for sulfatase activity
VRVNERRFSGLLAFSLLQACVGGTTAPAARLTLAFERAADVPVIEYLRVTWVGGGSVLADDRRVPASGALRATGLALGSFEIDVRDADVWRTVVARGVLRNGVVAEGALRVFVPAGKTTSATLGLRAGRLVDADDDGIPDAVDNCPDQNNRGQGACTTNPPVGDAAADARLADAAAPARPDDARATADRAPADRPADNVVPEAPGSDSRVVDSAAPALDTSLANGSPCRGDGECQTGHCAQGGAGWFCATPDMVSVPAGPFFRGCYQVNDQACGRDELPSRILTLKSFEIDRTEVTQAALDVCVQAGACDAPAGLDPRGHPAHPATRVTVAIAEAYCRWAGKRLPTEAEWEKAARGSDMRIYPWGDERATCVRAQYRDCGLLDVVPVAVLGGTSIYGAEDMAGNVAEWVSDSYQPDYYGTAPAVDPVGPAGGGMGRVRRGGGFSSDVAELRVSARAFGERDLAAQGFRCARDL